MKQDFTFDTQRHEDYYESRFEKARNDIIKYIDKLDLPPSTREGYLDRLYYVASMSEFVDIKLELSKYEC